MISNMQVDHSSGFESDQFFIEMPNDLSSLATDEGIVKKCITVMLEDISTFDQDDPLSAEEILRSLKPDSVVHIGLSDATQAFDAAFMLGRLSHKLGWPVYWVEMHNVQYFWVISSAKEFARRLAAAIYGVPS